ncbi:MAG: ubiquinol-cytochrome C chaperone, partial [Alphaproteobacteria bacterium]|nr:ubiquinol-cytochrome C chaperone [Alphaproteobacteria bacterium]
MRAAVPFGRNQLRAAAERAYGSVVEQARRPAFFTALGVPDTLDGRFELICLHAFLYLHRLKGEPPPAPALAQRFFDTMFADFDRSLREIGTSDLSVGRQVKRMAEAFYGRVRA